MKLLGGSENELAFGKEDESFTTACRTIVQHGYLIKSEAMVLHAILIKHNIIGVDTTYIDVKNNFPLMKTLMSKLSCGLETDPKKSLYGCQIVSDFDLAVNLQSKMLLFLSHSSNVIYMCSIADGKFNDKMSTLNVPLDSPCGLIIKKIEEILDIFCVKFET